MKKGIKFGMIMLMLGMMTGCGECEHEYDDGEITKEATCSEEGEKTYTCSLCGETKAEELDKKEHVYKEDVKEEPTFEEEGEKIFTCENCGYSYTEPIPVRDDEVVVSVTDKSNLPQDADAGRYSDRVELVFEVLNRTDRSVKGVQGKLTVYDLFGEIILAINCDFTGNSIPAGKSITVDDLGMEINQFMDEDVKFYNTDFDDLQFKYEVKNIVYEDGTGMQEQSSMDAMDRQEVTVRVTDKRNLEIDYNAGRFSPRAQFSFEVYNHTSKDIKGVQGILRIKDLFGVDILSSGLDFTGQIIGANSNITVSDMGIDINQFIDEEVKVYNTDFDDLNFEYEVTAIVYEDEEEQSEEMEETREDAGQEKAENDRNEDAETQTRAESDRNEDTDTQTRTESMTAEQAMQWLNGRWDAGDGVTYHFRLNADGTLPMPAEGEYWSAYSSGTWSCSGNTIVMTGFREETPGMGFGYMDREIRVVRKGENEATIEGTSYVSGHESEVPPSSTTKTMKRM